MEIESEANDPEITYLVAKSAASNDKCEIALELSLKLPEQEPLIRSEILAIVAKKKADKGEFDEAEEIAKNLTLHYLDTHNTTLIYVQRKRLIADLQKAVDAKEAREKRIEENCAIM